MASFNKVVLIGRLTRDPEMRYSSAGLAIAKFGLAVDRRFKNQQGERVTDFFDCSAFRQKAEFVEQYIRKGRLVAVEGSIEINEAVGQDGVKRKYVNIICENVEALDRGDDDGSGGGSYNTSRDSGDGSEAEEDQSPARPPRAAAPARSEARGGDDEDRPARAPRAAAPARGESRGNEAGGDEGGERPARRAPAKPAAAPMYPEDDFDDSDPFADE